MSETLNLYLTSFFNHWETQRLLRNGRIHNQAVEDSSPLELIETREDKKVDIDSVRVSFEESLTMSWFFFILNTVYSLIGIQLGGNLYESFNSYHSQNISFLSSQNIVGQTTIFFILLRVLFFPLIFWFYGKFWVNLIKFFGNLFEKEGDLDEIGQDIVAHAFTSHVLLIIPIVGVLFHRITSIIYIFGGLRKNLEFSVFQSLLVIVCPLFIIALSLLMMVVSIGIIISGL